MRVGDIVRFLNAVGGGKVVKIINKELVLVEEEDGFETPVLAKECIVISTANNSSIPPVPVSTTQPTTTITPPRAVIETREGNKINLTLAFLSQNIKMLSTSPFDIFLINDSNYYLSYCFMAQSDKGWINRSCGVLEPNMQLHLEEIEHASLNEIEQLAIAYIAYKTDKPFEAKEPVRIEIKVETVKFYKLHSFKPNDYFEENALLFPLVKDDQPCRSLTIDKEALAEAMVSPKEIDLPKMQPVKKNISTATAEEIDLHINELLDTTQGMSNGDIISYQIEKFKEVMEKYKSQKGKKIVFIHGKGDGVLRNALVKELRNSYSHCYYQDASFKEYGFGATLVTIK